MFEGQAFRLVGLLPPLDTMQDRLAAKPVRLDLLSDKINAVMEGNISDPLKGEGMDLKVRASVESVGEFFEIFANDIPALGSLEVTAMLRGDYATPRLEDIDLRLQRGEHIDLRVSGDVANVLTGEGSKLHISGQSDNLDVLSWLLFGQQDRLSLAQSGRAAREKQFTLFYFWSGCKGDNPGGPESAAWRCGGDFRCGA